MAHTSSSQSFELVEFDRNSYLYPSSSSNLSSSRLHSRHRTKSNQEAARAVGPQGSHSYLPQHAADNWLRLAAREGLIHFDWLPGSYSRRRRRNQHPVTSRYRRKENGIHLDDLGGGIGHYEDYNHSQEDSREKDDSSWRQGNREKLGSLARLATDEEIMKFSHSIQFNAVPDWSSSYIAYSNLKKL